MTMIYLSNLEEHLPEVRIKSGEKFVEVLSPLDVRKLLDYILLIQNNRVNGKVMPIVAEGIILSLDAPQGLKVTSKPDIMDQRKTSKTTNQVMSTEFVTIVTTGGTQLMIPLMTGTQDSSFHMIREILADLNSLNKL